MGEETEPAASGEHEPHGPGPRPASVFATGGLRLVVAHAVAYPIAVAWMSGFMPILFPLLDAELREAGGREVTFGGLEMPGGAAIVVRGTLVLGGVAFALVHAGGLLWARARDAKRARRAFVIFAGSLFAFACVGGAFAWAWLLVIAKR